MSSRHHPDSTRYLISFGRRRPIAPKGKALRCRCVSAASGEPFLSTRILIAEDEDLIREVATMALKKCGFEVQAVPDGRACLDTLIKGPAPDFLLLDLDMPFVGGLEVLEKLAVLDLLDRFPIAV